MKTFITISLSLLSAFTLFILLNEKEGHNTLKIKGNSFIEGLNVLHRENDTTAWTLTAKKAELRENENIVDLSDIIITVPKNGFRFYADKGLYDFSTQNFRAESEIKAESKDYKIVTSLIDYETSSGRIRTDKIIKVDGKKFKVEGKGMTMDSDRKIRILNDVKATFYK